MDGGVLKTFHALLYFLTDTNNRDYVDFLLRLRDVQMPHWEETATNVLDEYLVIQMLWLGGVLLRSLFRLHAQGSAGVFLRSPSSRLRV